MKKRTVLIALLIIILGIFLADQFNVIKIENLFGNNVEKESEQNNTLGLKNIRNITTGLIESKSQINSFDLENELHRLVNIERVNNQLSMLSWNDKLFLIALEHSKDMVARNFFEHENPDGESPTNRSDKNGYICKKNYGTYYTYGIGENLAKTPVQDNVIGCGNTLTVSSLAECIVKDWMNSQLHRKNILTKDYTTTAIAVAFNNESEALVTQNFC
jgi:uncharacterized protein YkwD